MDPHNFLYPVNPANVPANAIQPSGGFKKEVSRVMGSIVFFFIVYLLMFILSIGLVVACFMGGIAIITNFASIYGIIAGLGLMGVGLMVFIFLVKFLFSVSRYDRSGIIEVTETEQPHLFGFIRQLAKDTQTPLPKKIYLSADVNACVFYDSSFWSMFFPVRKNLQIGLGLVNTLNITEFKAVMAHEFGHFSQRSMKLGSFVYHVNKIIYNMLFDNKGYASFLQGWANVGNIFAIFANITAQIAQGIQAVLRGNYKLINKNYMKLSREMEFHADSVAASVSGSLSLVTALRRVELADTGYNITLQKCDELFRQKKVVKNIFTSHSIVLSSLSKEFNLPDENGLPVVNDEFLQQNNLSRVNYKDQWASHPTTQEREIHLKELNIAAEARTEKAWVLFRNQEEVQELLTKTIYARVTVEDSMERVEVNDFDEKLQQDMRQFSLPEVYNGFYDGRQVKVPETEPFTPGKSILQFEELFSAENGSLPKKIKAATADLEIIKAIQEKKVTTKSFDFDGVKYQQHDANKIANDLEEELKQMNNQLEEIDRQAIAFFFEQARQQPGNKANLLQDRYKEYFEHRRQAQGFLDLLNDMLGKLAPVYTGQSMQIADINEMIGFLKRENEPAFKQQLKYWLHSGVYEKEVDFTAKAEKFLVNDYVYFTGESFLDYELIELSQLSHESWDPVNTFLFREFKVILEMQLEMAGINNPVRVSVAP